MKEAPYKGCDDPRCKNCYPAAAPEPPAIMCSCGDPRCHAEQTWWLETWARADLAPQIERSAASVRALSDAAARVPVAARWSTAAARAGHTAHGPHLLQRPRERPQ